MALPRNLRRRSHAQTRQPEHREEAKTCSTNIKAYPRRTWRFYLRWFARIALVAVVFLSNAKVVRITPEQSPHSTVLLVITHSRSAYLKRCLSSILSYHPGGSRWPIVVSQDRQDGKVHNDVTTVAEEAQGVAIENGINLATWQHDVSYEAAIHQDEAFVDKEAYRKISRHYRWALRRLFVEGINGEGGVERVVVVEDDMEIAVDFYEYFDALTPILEADPTLFCVSAWNDNGIESLALNSSQLHRTDFFPGLGWMLTKSLWRELDPKWPEMFWDDWLRSTEQTKGRQCIRPEISRTANFGETGVSQSFHYKKHVSKVVLNTEFVKFDQMNLSYLEPSTYHHMIFSRLSDAVKLKFSNYLTSKPQDSDVIAMYPDGRMDAIGKRTGIMIDHRNGIRRTSYCGVIVFPWNGHWAFAVPSDFEPPEGYRLGASICCGR